MNNNFLNFIIGKFVGIFIFARLIKLDIDVTIIFLLLSTAV